MKKRSRPEIPEVTIHNMLKPDGMWANCIYRWESGDPIGVKMLLLDGVEIPEFARKWLASAIAGEVPQTKKRGRKPQKSSLFSPDSFFKELEIRSHFNHRKLVAKYGSRQKEHGTPKEIALSECAEKFGLTEDEISHIVYPRKKRGS